MAITLQSCRILGIDPGSRITGFGLIDSDGRRSVHVASGTIRTGEGALGRRLELIFQGVQQLMALHAPAVVAVEQVFMHRNADSALKLGQARSAAICATFGAGAELFEYAPRSVKQAVVGLGQADKTQVAHMVAVLLNYREPLAPDASDALAVALCHAHTRPLLSRLAAANARTATATVVPLAARSFRGRRR
ncbi:MAG: crossover junction endodeoxyribonuclease RuvC [Gammaproteobacteria bacterium]|nr:crossover junction endodeoxyribonuclease RuvC [Gammaproteobacteria bacterium]